MIGPAECLQLYLFAVGPNTSLEGSGSYIEFQNSLNARDSHLDRIAVTRLSKDIERTEKRNCGCNLHRGRDCIKAGVASRQKVT